MIGDVRLQNFRSYTDTTFEFEPGVNIVVGPNASGKTNLLEAILILCKGSSYRAPDQQLLTHEADWARIDSGSADVPRSVLYRFQDNQVKREFKIGGTTLTRLPLARRLPVVVFEPSNLQLLTESPEKRRTFLDDIIEQIQPGYEKIRRDYKRTLAQRNALLKRRPSANQLFVWDVRLSELGAQLATGRQSFVTAQASLLAGLYSTLAQKKHHASLLYQTNIATTDYAGSMLRLLKSRLPIDIERGFTSTGPHRDDLVPLLDGHQLIQTGSRGEVRTVLLALKLLELKALEEALEVKPILLLDDVFSELDGARRRALTAYLQDHQTFITTTDADIVVQHFMDNCHVIPTS